MPHLYESDASWLKRAHHQIMGASTKVRLVVSGSLSQLPKLLSISVVSSPPPSD